jgi:hypothetical protein
MVHYNVSYIYGMKGIRRIPVIDLPNNISNTPYYDFVWQRDAGPTEGRPVIIVV